VPLYDSHLHLQDPRLVSVIGKLAEQYERDDVEAVVVNATQESDWGAVGQLAELFPFVKPAFGVHPWYVFDRSTHWMGNLEYCIDHYGGSIGEVGLDCWLEDYDLDWQAHVFTKQLQLATKKNIPVSIHCLKAWGRLLEILKQEDLPEVGLLLHSFSGSHEMATELSKLGCYFSFSGYFLQEKKVKVQETFKQIPLDRILVETDAPDQPLPEELNRLPLPEDEEGKIVNHPANIVAVYEGLADVLGLSQEELTSQVAKNFQRLFN